jgi:hypothetical protein
MARSAYPWNVSSLCDRDARDPVEQDEMKKEPAKNGDEQDWCSRGWRRFLCVFHNNTGLGKAVKRRMNKRARQREKMERDA